MDKSEQPKNWFQRRNWWKIAFFVLLIVFEFTREVAVFSINSEPKIMGNAIVGRTGTYTAASGKWTRIDKEEDLMPASVKIECSEPSGLCTEATVMILNGQVGSPNVERFEANFEPDAVSYQNDNPACVTYNTRIDLKLNKVLSVRQIKDDADKDACKGNEERIEMTLGDGWRSKKDPFEGHFLPFLQVLALILKQ